MEQENCVLEMVKTGAGVGVWAERLVDTIARNSQLYDASFSAWYCNNFVSSDVALIYMVHFLHLICLNIIGRGIFLLCM